MHAGYSPAAFYADSRASSVSEPNTGLQMKTYPSQQSIDSRSFMTASRKSLNSNFTSYTAHTNMSYALAIVTDAPDLEKKPPDNWGCAFVSLFINPIFGLFALLFAEQSKLYFIKRNYVKAGQYGSYAKGIACGGMICTVIVLCLIFAIVINNYYMFNI